MSIFGMIGGLAAAYNGVQGGIDQAQKREDAKVDREWQLANRDRARADWGNQDEDLRLKRESDRRLNQLRMEGVESAEDTRKKLAAVPQEDVTTETSTPVSYVNQSSTDPSAPPTFGEPVKGPTVTTEVRKPRMLDQILRDEANIYGSKGDRAKFHALNTQADSIAASRMNDKFTSIKAGADGKTAYELATATKELFDNDPAPGKIDVIDDLGNGGVRVKIRNERTGAYSTKDYADPAALMGDMEGYFSPATVQARAEAARKHREKLEELAYKDRYQNVKAGGTLYDTLRNTSFSPEEPNKDAYKVPNSAWDRVLKAHPTGQELDPQKAAAGRVLTAQLMADAEARGNPMPPDLAAAGALKAMMAPGGGDVALDPETGEQQLRIRFDDSRYGDVRVRSSTLTPEQLATQVPEMVKAQTFGGRIKPEKFMAAAHGDAGLQQEIRAAALTANPAYAKTRYDMDQARERAKNKPEILQAIEMQERQALASIEADIDANLARKFELTKMYTKPPVVPGSAPAVAPGSSVPLTTAPAVTPSGTPTDIADQITADLEKKRLQRQAESTAAAAEKARIKQNFSDLNKETSWMEPRVIAVMKKQDAQKYLDQYGDRLSPTIRNRLINRIQSR